jgi:hypothetical protein
MADVERVTIRHIGSQDKPVFPLVISNAPYREAGGSRIDANRYVVLPSTEFARLGAYVAQQANRKQDLKARPFGTIEVERVSRGSSSKYVVAAGDSCTYLTDMVKAVQDGADLRKAVKTMRVRFGCPE